MNYAKLCTKHPVITEVLKSVVEEQISVSLKILQHAFHHAIRAGAREIQS